MPTGGGESPLLIPADQAPSDLVLRPVAGVVAVSVGDETVLVDGWASATVLSPAAAAIWCSFDGTATVRQVIDDLAGLTALDPSALTAEVHRMVLQVGSLGLLEGVGPPAASGLHVRFEKTPRFDQPGSPLPEFTAVDLDDNEVRSSSLRGHETVIVNWNPHCGYCVSIAHVVAACEPDLEARGVHLVLLASASAAANRELLRSSSIHNATVLRLADGHKHPFPGVGTPAAYHLDPDLRLTSPPAYGNTDVPQLLNRVAGVAPHRPAHLRRDGGVRYLLQSGGACPPGTGSEPVPQWVGTRVYRFGDFHVGLRCATPETVDALDSLFVGAAVEDPDAGHSYAVSLRQRDQVLGSSPAGADGEWNLLVQGPNVFVRSGSPGRVLRGLLWRLHHGIVDFDPACGRLQVKATAALVADGVVLLQPGLHVLAERLQPLLAQRGIALGDAPAPEIDLRTREVVLPEPAIAYDGAVVAAYDTPVDPRFELPAVGPGRYPLVGWGVMHPAEAAVTRFTPAQAAAATLSLVHHTDDVAARLSELGDLFSQVMGFGLSYHSEAGYADALGAALGLG